MWLCCKYIRDEENESMSINVSRKKKKKESNDENWCTDFIFIMYRDLFVWCYWNFEKILVHAHSQWECTKILISLINCYKSRWLFHSPWNWFACFCYWFPPIKIVLSAIFFTLTYHCSTLTHRFDPPDWQYHSDKKRQFFQTTQFNE